MSYETNTEISEKSVKPVKRVRFSDEVKNVYEFEHDDDDENEDSGSENFPMEDISYIVPSSNFAEDDLHLEEQTDDFNNINKETVVDDAVLTVHEISTSHDSVHLKSTDLNDTAFLSHEDNQLNNETIIDVSESCSSPRDSEYLVENTVNELITETSLMMISSAETCMEEKNSNCQEEISEHSVESKLQDSDLCVDVISAEQTYITNSQITGRSVEVSPSEKQTSQLNNYLQKNNTDINSADKLKDAVFKAWCEVKKKKTDVQNVSSKPNVRKNMVASQKTSSHDAFEAWQKSKRKAKANASKESKPTFKKTEEDLKESKMAFQAWKKKKDELLQQQKAEKIREKEKEKIEKLMKERKKKNAAESAYVAWSAHKVLIGKMEREKSQWFLEKEKEKMSEKKRRYEEAAKIYYDWLEDKVYSTRKYNQKITDYKPPWVPPGKANSVM